MRGRALQRSEVREILAEEAAREKALRLGQVCYLSQKEGT